MIQIFYLKKQEPLAKRLIPLLKREMLGDDDAHVDRAVIGNDYGRDSSKQEHIYCAKYVELLKASIISTSDFGTILLSGQDKWCYMGSDKEPLHGSQPLLRLSRKNLALAFPAVAILGRMVMLPQALH